MGKAVKMASATVTSGTSAMVVVKVRLLADRPSRSSRKRSRRVSAVLRQGKWERWRRKLLQPCGQTHPAMMPPPCVQLTRRCGSAACWRWRSLLGLIVLGLAWELWLAPLRPGGSWLALKVLPLCLPLAGLLKNRMYTYRWLSLLVWLYFTEGVVRATSEAAPGAWLAGAGSAAEPDPVCRLRAAHPPAPEGRESHRPHHRDRDTMSTHTELLQQLRQIVGAPNVLTERRPHRLGTGLAQA